MTNVPKPAAQRRRRNAVPAAKVDRRLPTTGRAGLAPSPPVPLGINGKRWWDWAWSTPQATTWNHDGFTETLVKRAQLEDLFATREISAERLVPLMLRIDDSLGFTPKAAAQLHMTFAEPEPEAPTDPKPVTDIRDRLKRLG